MRTAASSRHLAILAVAALAALAAEPPARAAEQGCTVVFAGLNNSTIELRAGDTRLLRVRLTACTPVIGAPVDWQIVSSTAGATGAGVSLTNNQGIAERRFRFPGAGTTVVRAVTGTVTSIVVQYTVISTLAPPPPPGPTPGGGNFDLQLVGSAQQSLILGDRGSTSARVVDANGRPVAGIGLLFAVETSPGSPGVGRSNQTVVTGADGIATASFGFSTAGRTTIRVVAGDSRVILTPGSILYTFDTASLGALRPERRSYRSLGEALDAVCLDVFVDAGGQRPTPRPTPLCVYMTGTLTSRAQRADAMVALTSTGLGSQATTALAGMEQQTGSIQSRLSALRGGALRGAVDQVALEIDGVTLDGELLASARAADRLDELFGDRLDGAFARLYAGLDAQDAPVSTDLSAAAPVRDRPWGFFVTGRLTQGEQEESVEETGFDFDTVGATIGVDRAVGANGFFGVALSSLANETDLLFGGGTLDSDAFSVTLYAIREGEKGYFQATASAGSSQFDQSRRISLPVVGALTASADFDGEQLGATIEFGRSIDGRAGSLTFFARGSFANATIDGFSETGATATIPGTGFGVVDFGLEVGEQEIDSLLGEAGLDWGRAFSTGSGLVIPQLAVTWTREFEDGAVETRARFLGDQAAGSSFFVFGDEPDTDWLTASASLRFQFLWGSLFVAYDQELMRDDLETRTVNAGLRFEF